MNMYEILLRNDLQRQRDRETKTNQIGGLLLVAQGRIVPQELLLDIVGQPDQKGGLGPSTVSVSLANILNKIATQAAKGDNYVVRVSYTDSNSSPNLTPDSSAPKSGVIGCALVPKMNVLAFQKSLEADTGQRVALEIGFNQRGQTCHVVIYGGLPKLPERRFYQPPGWKQPVTPEVPHNQDKLPPLNEGEQYYIRTGSTMVIRAVTGANGKPVVNADGRVTAQVVKSDGQPMTITVPEDKFADLYTPL